MNGRFWYWTLGTGLAVAVLAVYLHSGNLHGAMAWDEADYATAARQGLWANAWSGTLEPINHHMRHAHPPGMVYAVWGWAQVFGWSAEAMRWPGLIGAGLGCLLMVLGVADLASGPARLRLGAGAVAGLAMAGAPASIGFSPSISLHLHYTWVIVGVIWMVSRFVRQPTHRRAVCMGLAWAAVFIMTDFGWIVLCISAAALAWARPQLLGLGARWPWIRLTARPPFVRWAWQIWLALGTGLAAVTILWPGGVLKLAAAANFAYYLLYAAGGHPVLFRGELYQHVPRYAYGWWYAQSHPLLLIAMLGGMMLIGWWVWQSGRRSAKVVVTFIVVLGLMVHTQHIMRLEYSLFMIPPLIMGIGLAGAWTDHRAVRRSRVGRPLSWLAIGNGAQITGTLLVAAMLLGGGQYHRRDKPYDEAEQVLALCEWLAEQADYGDHVLAHAWPMVRFNTHFLLGRDDLKIIPLDPRNISSPEQVTELARSADWALVGGGMTAKWPDCPVLGEVRGNWSLVQRADVSDNSFRLFAAPRSNLASFPSASIHESR